MGESDLTGRLAAPLRGAPGCFLEAPSPIVRRPLGGGLEKDLKGLCGGSLASLRSVSVICRQPVL
eukprot:12302476-Alexandrium_andersonii.AAC.1